MKNHDTITVNGQSYDTLTGLPVNKTPVDIPSTRPVKTKNEATTLHAHTQKSATLRRVSIKKPKQQPVPPEEPTINRRPRRRLLDIARHPQVKKVADSRPIQAVNTPDIAPRTHPSVEKANRHIQQKKSAAPTTTKTLSTKEVKDAEISRVLSHPQKKSKSKQPKKQSSHRKKRLTRIGIIAGSILVILGVTLWINLPSISVKIASAQAGISAGYPHYTPDGYALQLPINAQDSQVSITFHSLQSDSSFTLVQAKSSWNSEAVRSMVEQDSNGRFLTTQDRGLTVYTYDGNAAWVNKGTLYTLKGNSRFSNDTIMRIANSL